MTELRTAVTPRVVTKVMSTEIIIPTVPLSQAHTDTGGAINEID